MDAVAGLTADRGLPPLRWRFAATYRHAPRPVRLSAGKCRILLAARAVVHAAGRPVRRRVGDRLQVPSVGPRRFMTGVRFGGSADGVLLSAATSGGADSLPLVMLCAATGGRRRWLRCAAGAADPDDHAHARCPHIRAKRAVMRRRQPRPAERALFTGAVASGPGGNTGWLRRNQWSALVPELRARFCSLRFKPETAPGRRCAHRRICHPALTGNRDACVALARKIAALFREYGATEV